MQVAQLISLPLRSSSVPFSQLLSMPSQISIFLWVLRAVLSSQSSIIQHSHPVESRLLEDYLVSCQIFIRVGIPDFTIDGRIINFRHCNCYQHHHIIRQNQGFEKIPSAISSLFSSSSLSSQSRLFVTKSSVISQA